MVKFFFCLPWLRNFEAKPKEIKHIQFKNVQGRVEPDVFDFDVDLAFKLQTLISREKRINKNDLKFIIKIIN